jgi:hypothetical protein
MSNISMVAPSRTFFISFELKPLVILLPRKGYLQHFGSKIAKIVRSYCHNLDQSEKNIFDLSLCEPFQHSHPVLQSYPVLQSHLFLSLILSYRLILPYRLNLLLFPAQGLTMSNSLTL